MSHVIITGTGRAGTSFLVRLLTALGADTGFDNPDHCYRNDVRAGMETHIPKDGICSAHLPRIIKDPRICRRIKNLVEGGLEIDIVLVPIRDLDEATQSRIDADLYWLPEKLNPEGAPPGTVRAGEISFEEQKTSLATSLGTLFSDLVSTGTRYRVGRFEDIVKNSKYCRTFLEGVVPAWVTSEKFDSVHKQLCESVAKTYVETTVRRTA